MKIVMLDLHVASLPMRLMIIGLVKECLDNNRPSFQHRHNLFELQYVFEGECVTRIGETLCTQQRDKIYLISPGVYHSQKSSSSPYEKMCITFEILAPPEAGNKPAKEVFDALNSVQYFTCNAEVMGDTLTYLRSAFLDHENRVCGTDELRIITELLILQLVQRISSSGKQESPAGIAKVQRVYLIDEFFNHNFHRNDGDVLLAEKLGVSIRQLNRILQSLYGCNFREKLLEIRLEVAIDLLASRKSIAQISEITGYSCPANFSTFIKNATGKTPSEIRMLKYARIEEPGQTLM